MAHERCIGFDADDTLWHNENIFEKVHERYYELLKRHHDSATVERAMPTESAISRALAPRPCRRRITSRIFRMSMGLLDNSSSQAKLGQGPDVKRPQLDATN